MFVQQHNARLDGVLDWIRENGGSVSPFNDHVDVGHIKGYRYRFFRSEGWIGLKTPDCEPGKSLSFESKDDFIRTVESLPVLAS